MTIFECCFFCLFLGYVLVFNFSQDGYLPDGGARDSLRLRLKLDLLQRYDLLCRLVNALVDDSIGTLAQGLDLLDLVNLTETELRLLLLGTLRSLRFIHLLLPTLFTLSKY